jgi:predicted  nucleic acid-binding Zn-ribbon protein
MPIEMTAFAAFFAGLIPSVAMAIRLRSEVRKNNADASRAAFDMVDRQLTVSIATVTRLEDQVRLLTTEIVALRERIGELEGILDEIQRANPGAVRIATARRRQRQPKS